MQMKHIDPAKLTGREPYKLITSLVVPRPIAWVSTVSEDGILNVAPHSYFNVISSNPMILHFTSTGVKDTLTNVRATGEFVINVVSRAAVEKMNMTSANFPPQEDEFAWAGLTPTPSTTVSAPRVGEAKAAFECKLRSILSMGNGNMVFGDVQAVHIEESLLVDGRVDPVALDPVGRMGGAAYTAAAGDLFELDRPTYDQLKDTRS